jgi:hypothetical protein
VSSWKKELRRLEFLESDHPLLPVGWGADKKAPMLRQWPTHPGFSCDEVSNHRGVIACGVRTDRLWCVDYDGETAIAFAKEQGLDPSTVATWRVNRNTSSSRFKLLFLPTETQISRLKANGVPSGNFSFKSITGDAEQLEQFFTPGRQVIVCGNHCKSRGYYYWPDSNGPEALAVPPDTWWQWVVAQAAKQPEAHQQSSKKPAAGNKSWMTLRRCPICGRNQHSICQIHRDEETIRCFRGGTFSPPGGLAPGDRIGEWRYCREQTTTVGDFAIFNKVQPSLTWRLRKALSDG